MKKIIASLLSVFATVILFAQDVRLSDSVIFINNEPVAFYAKEINNSPLRYNIEVYNFTDDVLIKAEVIKFDAPVYELKPFYYYELTFPPTGDTFAIYIEEEAFPLVLGKIIKDYNLISKNKLNRRNVRYFKATYYGGLALLAKLKAYEDYLDRTRYYREQVKRNRNKPVKIINNRVIMQDDVKIGNIAEVEDYNQPERSLFSNPSLRDNGNSAVINPVVSDYTTAVFKETEIFLANHRKVEFYKSNYVYKNSTLKEKTGKSLYEISKPEKSAAGSYADQVLKLVCYLIEEFAL